MSLSSPRYVALVLPLLAVVGCGAPAQEQPAPKPAAAAAPTELTYDQLVQAARSYLDAGKLDRAAQVAGEAAAKDPSKADAHVIVARAAFLSGNTAAALEHYGKAHATGLRDKRVLMEVAGAYDLAGDPARALTIYEELVAQHPKDPEVHQEMGLTAVRAGDLPKGIASLRQAIELAPKAPQLRLDLGYALLLAGDAAGAEEMLLGVPAEHAGHYKAQQFLAQVRASQGRLDEALELLSKAVAGSGNDPEPTRLRARMRSLSGDAAGALADYDKLLKADAEDGSALIGAIGALIQLDRLDEANTRLSQARTVLGDQPPVQFRAAQLGWRGGDAQAVQTIATYAESHPTSLEAWREVAAAAARFKDKALSKKAKQRLSELEGS